MRVQLTFNLPDEAREYWCAAFGSRLLFVLAEIREELRRHRKYVEHGEETSRLVEELEQFFFDSCDNNSVDIDLCSGE